MNLLHNALLLTALAPTLPTQSAGDQAPVVVAGERGERLDRYLTRLSRLGFSGSVLIEKGGEVLLAKGYGMADLAAGVPCTTRTVVSMGSITKHFTAACILRLEMDGALSLQDTLGLLFEEVPADKADVTLHQLLSHTSGLPDSAETMLRGGERDEFIARALAVELIAPPGAEFSYSNMGFGLLAAIVEVASGEPYEAALRALVLAPAGMTRSGFSADLWPAEDLAHGYINGSDTGTLFGDGSLDGWGIRGSGGLHTCIYDMLRWNRALDAGEVLSPEAQAKMGGRHAPMGPGQAYGYGIGVRTTPRGTTRLGHNGSNDVFSADFGRYPEDGVMIYVQANDADVYTEDVAPVLEAIVFGGEVDDPPEVIALDDAALAHYAGVWRLESGAELAVSAGPGRLELSSDALEGARLVHPVTPNQVARRDALLDEVETAFGLALEGEFEALHGLIAPFTPLQAFVENQGAHLENLRRRGGELEGLRTYSGFNRFGEIAVVLEFAFERGPVLLEYSFGAREVGSIRFLAAPPARVLRPTSPGEFVTYDAATGETWGVRFELDGDDLPEALVLFDERGVEHVATR